MMVAVLDEQGDVIPGFEAEKCVIRNEDRTRHPAASGAMPPHGNSPDARSGSDSSSAAPTSTP